MKRILAFLKNNILLIFIILNILIHYVWFFNLSYLTSGDVGVYLPETQSELIVNSTQIYNNDSFGSVDLGASSKLITLLHGVLSKIGINYNIGIRIIYFIPIIILAPIGFYLLFKKIFKLRPLSILISFFVFFFNTYILLLQSGQLMLVTAMSLSSFVFYYFIYTLEEKKVKNSIIFSLLAFIVGSYDFRVFYIVAIILFLYFLYYSFLIENGKKIILNIKIVLLPLALTILMNFYWLFGLLKVGSVLNNSLFSRGLFGNQFFNIKNSLTLFHSFWTGTKTAVFVVQNIPLYNYIIPIIAFLGLVLNRKNKNVVFFGIVTLVGIFLSKQVCEPFGFVYEWLFKNFPGFNAFREASKFYFLVAFGYSVLIGFFIEYILVNLNKNKFQKISKNIVIVVIMFIFLWNTKPLITGDIEALFALRHVPTDYLILENSLTKQFKYFKTYWTPIYSRWSIFTNTKPKVSNIDIIQSDWSNYINYENNGYSWPVQDQIVDIYKKDFSNQLFDNSSIKYVIVPLQDKENDDDFYIYYGGQENPNIRQWYIDQLDKVTWLKKVDIETKDLVVYENENYKDHIYSTNEIDSVYKNIKSNNVEYKFINPTEYRISLKNIKENTYINFTDKFNSEWKLRLGKFNWINVLIDKNYFVDDKYHFENDAKLNSFEIDPEYIKKNFDKSYYKENPDGSIDIELTLYFKPQSYFYLGLIISGTTLAGCITYLIIDGIKNKKKKDDVIELQTNSEDIKK